MTKIESRKRRSAKTKARIKGFRIPRIVVFRSNQHIYAQLVEQSDKGDIVKASSSSLDKSILEDKENKIDIASKVGKALGQKISKLGIDKIAFDRSGYKYHGRIKALADGVRAEGVEL